MITIKLIDARRGLYLKCRELFGDEKIAENIYNYLCEGIEECEECEPERKNGKWTPCSETIDIPDYEVLACDKYGEYIIGLLAYEDDQWLCESEETMMYDPIAWMPLPEIYRGEQE